MIRLLIRRLAFTLFMIVAIIFTCLLVVHVAASGGEAPLLDTAKKALTGSGEYLWDALHGDLGMAIASRYRMEPTTTLLARTYPKSMGLLLVALFLAALVGVPLGTLAALKRYSRLSPAIVTTSVLGISAPSFFVAMLLQIAELLFYKSTGVRLLPLFGFGWDRHLLLPALALAAAPTARIARLTYITLSDVLEKEYMRTAHAKGLGAWAILLRHAFSNAAIPVLTSLGVSIRQSLSVLPVVEYFFSWPGVGLQLLRSLRWFDARAVTGLVLSLGVTFLLIDLALEILYRRFDPKLRGSGGA